MQTRRDFIRNAAMLSGTAFAWGMVPEAIARALEIDPEHGSTFHDAEHVVILMQENRSFDHAYGTLQGVRGYRDPRPHLQPNGTLVWFQTDSHGKTYSPFRLDIHNTKVTWIGGLPHSWHDQIDARNGGRYDKWLIAKPNAELPFTLGHYTREDIPFYYALADAFTICDQAFCSSLTGTTPNRLFLWTGNIRKDASDMARTLNDDTDYGIEAAWTTFPERLEDAGVSWRVYQNEISLDSGFEGEQDDWLGNFTDNPLEWFTQYNVRFAKSRRDHLDRLSNTLAHRITEKERAREVSKPTGDEDAKLVKEIADLKAQLKVVDDERAVYTGEKWENLPSHSKAIHEKAFASNDHDPTYRDLDTLRYRDGETERDVQVPKSDILSRFRKDVDSGNLPAVSWVVAPCNFSDHPGAAWYGAWYVSEVLGILTKDPEVWKKTVFILCYDENDGYFDHVPPFVAPFPDRPETGLASQGIDTAIDVANVHDREHSIGLGYRVPLVIASPWSRGGCVNSQVFDHTSIIQFVETWLAGKGKEVKETNISDWRRCVCGDLTSVFQPYSGQKIESPKALSRNAFIEEIHAAKFKKMPVGGDALSADDIAHADVGSVQERGTRKSCPLPYELRADATRENGGIVLRMEAANEAFGKHAQGAPFNAYSYTPEFKVKSYAAKAGGAITDHWAVGDIYHVRVDGPNGFMREFKGDASEPPISVRVTPHASTGKVELHLQNSGATPVSLEIADEHYGAPKKTEILQSGEKSSLTLDTKQGWYDFTVSAGTLAYRYAGRVETGRWGITDPAMA